MSSDIDNANTTPIVSQEIGQESKVSIAVGQTAIKITNTNHQTPMVIVVINPGQQLEEVTRSQQPIQTVMQLNPLKHSSSTDDEQKKHPYKLKKWCCIVHH